MIADEHLDIIELSPRERSIFWEGYRSGVFDGIDIGRSQADVEAAASWSAMAERIRRMAATSVPYSVLCELRGEPERAERARAHETRVAAGREL